RRMILRCRCSGWTRRVRSGTRQCAKITPLFRFRIASRKADSKRSVLPNRFDGLVMFFHLVGGNRAGSRLQGKSKTQEFWPTPAAACEGKILIARLKERYGQCVQAGKINLHDVCLVAGERQYEWFASLRKAWPDQHAAGKAAVEMEHARLCGFVFLQEP